MSIVTLLAKQNAILRRNDLQFQMLRNSSLKQGLLSFEGNLNQASAIENSLDLENIQMSSELMALNAELNSIKNYENNKLNYLA